METIHDILRLIDSTSDYAAIKKQLDISKDKIESIIRNEAKSVQDACNPVAVSLLLHNLGRILLRLGYDTKGIESHPAFLAVLGKICSLCVLDHDSTKAYGALYEGK